MKILQMTTYSLDKPNQGGKLRCYHIRKSLRQTFDVETLSFEWSDNSNAETFQVVLDQAKCKELNLNGLLIDWGVCDYLEYDEEIYLQVMKNIKSYAPDTIFLEQPFLWPLVKRLLADEVVSENTKIIYSSQNIEVGMKKKIYFDAFPEDLAERYTNYVDAIEKEVITCVDGTLAVSKNDYDYISELAPNTPVLVLPNGNTKPVNNEKSEKWQKVFSNSEYNWVFVGSWHPPNINGLRDLLEAMPDSIDSSDFSLFVLGEVGNGLLSMEDFCLEKYPYLNIMGPVSAEDIDAAIINSSGIVLPIWEGGGSNLKTAQALLSGKCVVGSNFSFRGFESCMNEEGVFLGEKPEDVSKKLIKIRPECSYNRSDKVTYLDWEEITKGLNSFITEVASASK